MTICTDCAINKGLMPKNKIIGTWVAECPYCRQERAVFDEAHDFKHPGQRTATLEDILLVGMVEQ